MFYILYGVYYQVPGPVGKKRKVVASRIAEPELLLKLIDSSNKGCTERVF